jgi:hypothetical protein
MDVGRQGRIESKKIGTRCKKTEHPWVLKAIWAVMGKFSFVKKGHWPCVPSSFEAETLDLPPNLQLC